MRELVFSVAMTPIGKARARTVTGEDGRTHSYTPAATVNAEAEIRAAFDRAYPRHTPHDGPVELDVLATFTVPPSWPKWRKAAAAIGLIRVTVKPDWDNIGKLTDALSKIAYLDDSQVFDGHVRKEYGPAPRLLVRMRLFDQPTRADFEAAS
jgi:Holliday junction resolvase RusA-like endonuclease